jgi:beta-phosphoglucomutase-like phosphatase (HAD superfamily)
MPPSVEVTFDGLLFDMDGTLVDSTRAIEEHWKAYGGPCIDMRIPDIDEVL